MKYTFLFLAIGRTLIPRYFRSIFEGGVTELYYNMKHPKESFHNTSITLDCDQCTMVTHHGKPLFTKVGKFTYFINNYFEPVDLVNSLATYVLKFHTFIHQIYLSHYHTKDQGNTKLFIYMKLLTTEKRIQF